MTYHHGARVTEASTGIRAFLGASTAVIGMVAIASDADDTVFPLNTPVLISDVRAAIDKGGEAGTLAPSLEAISDQTSPVAVIVRVAEGTGDGAQAATNTNVSAGLNKLLTAKSTLGVKPKILGCPGLDKLDCATTLATVAGKLDAMAYASALGGAGVDTVAEAVTYRAGFEARELMLLYPDFKSGGATASAVARALGLRARIDEEQGWNKTLSNVPVRGVTGISLPVSWELTDPSTDAGILNAAQITTLINSNGYRFWGSRTCADDPLFAFESATRTAQVLKETIANGLMWAVDKPLHPSLARDIIESINAEFRKLKQAGLIIGGEAFYDPSANSNDSLAAGELHIDYEYTSTPPLENLGLTQRVTDRFFADFSALAASPFGA